LFFPILFAAIALVNAEYRAGEKNKHERRGTCHKVG
jgi:hypothetical protein